jgi:Putative prokaryotic signal transducing protein
MMMLNWLRGTKRKPKTDPPVWMVVLETIDIAEAHIVAGRLRAEGIHAWVHQEPGASAIGITVGVLGRIHVLVNAADYAAAVRILDEDEAELLEDLTSQERYLDPEGHMLDDDNGTQ